MQGRFSKRLLVLPTIYSYLCQFIQISFPWRHLPRKTKKTSNKPLPKKRKSSKWRNYHYVGLWWNTIIICVKVECVICAALFFSFCFHIWFWFLAVLRSATFSCEQNKRQSWYSCAPQYRKSRDQQISSVIGGFSLLPIQRIKRNDLKGPRFSIRYSRISVTLGSGIAGFNCM